MGIKLTKEIVNERIKDRGIELIGEYITNKTPALFRCSYNHTWEAFPGVVMERTGCSICYRIGKIVPKKIVDERLKGRGIELIGEYSGIHKKSLFRCFYNHTLPYRQNLG
jgi:hypothetical protein